MRKLCDFSFAIFIINSIKIVLRWSYSIYRMPIEHWLLVVIISHGFCYLNVHFLWRKLCWKTVVRYVTLNPIDVNDDVNFSIYILQASPLTNLCCDSKTKHRGNVVRHLMPGTTHPTQNVVKLSLRKFSVVRQLRTWVYLRTNLQFFTRKKVLWIAIRT